MTPPGGGGSGLLIKKGPVLFQENPSFRDAGGRRGKVGFLIKGGKNEGRALKIEKTTTY